MIDTETSALRRERRRQKMSLRELAHFAECSHMTIQRAEAGTLNIAPATKARIARALRTSVAELWPLNEPSPGGRPDSETNHDRLEIEDVGTA